MQYGKHLSVAKDQQYRCHDFEPACCIRITKFCQQTLFAPTPVGLTRIPTYHL
jgi:hypothetical protein